MQTDPIFAKPGRFLRGNIHTHSTASDARLDPAEVCSVYRDAGYDFLAVTDHFLAKFSFPIVDTRPFRANGFTTLLGAEVHAPATSLGETWHILAVGLPLDFASTPPDETGAALASRCIDAGAFVAIAHPAWYALSLEDALTLEGAHAVEIYNHTTHLRTDRGDGSHLADQMLAAGRRISLIAVDDAHFQCPDWFGGWLMVKATANEPDMLLAALKAGDFYSTQGPRIEGIQWGEDSVEVHCSPASSVMVLGAGSRAAQSVAPLQTRVTLPLARLKGSRFARIVVADAEGRRAWSNPHFFG